MLNVFQETTWKLLNNYCFCTCLHLSNVDIKNSPYCSTLSCAEGTIDSVV